MPSKLKPKLWYKPFTWVPPEVEKWIDKKGKERIRVKRAGYLKLTHEPGSTIKSAGREYVVQQSGALKRIGINRSARRKDKNRPQKEGRLKV